MGGWVFWLVGVWFNVLYWRYLVKEGSYRRSAGVQTTGFFRANKKCCFEPPHHPPNGKVLFSHPGSTLHGYFSNKKLAEEMKRRLGTDWTVVEEQPLFPSLCQLPI